MFVSHTGLRQTVKKLDDLEKYWANATSNFDTSASDLIKSS